MIKTIQNGDVEKNMSKTIGDALRDAECGDTIRFEKGVYHLYSDGCVRDMFCTTNNDSGVKNVAFLVLDKDDIIIDGQNSTFVVHEDVYPFIIQNSKNITLKNIVLDFANPVYAYATVVEQTNERLLVDMRVDEDSTCYRVNERHNIVFCNDEKEFSSAEGKWTVGEFNPDEMRSETDTWLTYFCVGERHDGINNPAVSINSMDAYDLGNGRVELRYKTDGKRKKYKAGNGILINYRNREYGNIFIDKSTNTKIENVKILRGVGMGVIAQNSEDINIDKLEICPKAGRFGAMSITADCVHVLNCRGALAVTNSVFCRSFDDPLNVHGMYTVVDKVLDDTKIKVKLMHQDQRYINIYEAGDPISIIDTDTSKIADTKTVKSSRLTEDGEYVVIELEETAENIKEGMLAENPSAMPTVYYAGNLLKDASRLLCANSKRTVIEKNTFDGVGNPIFITDCPNYWYESGRVCDMTISENVFKRSCYKGSRCPVIIRYENDRLKVEDDKYLTVHKNIKITDNVIENTDFAIVEANNVDNLTITNNTVKKSGEDRRLDKKQVPYELSCCTNVLISGNKLVF